MLYVCEILHEAVSVCGIWSPWDHASFCLYEAVSKCKNGMLCVYGLKMVTSSISSLQ